MTRATKNAPVPARVETAAPSVDEAPSTAPESVALTSALRFAQGAALGLAKGTGGLAKGTGAVTMYLLGQGVSLAKSARSRRRSAPVLALVDEQAVADAVKPVRGKRRGRRVVLVLVTGAAVAAVAVLVKKQRTEAPPVADAPPSLRDLENA
ncbi:hypothetical protein [Rhodococcus sp. NPDC127528]|uniref:hypothetical protein n=1 Tax=unclassified Rhodococcus (in: high G+C Gram-positive bacteria) TaxID=192944 RepID=UPI00362B69EB